MLRTSLILTIGLTFISLLKGQENKDIALIPYPKSLKISNKKEQTKLTKELTIFCNTVFPKDKIEILTKNLHEYFNCSVGVAALSLYDTNYGANAIIIDTFSMPYKPRKAIRNKVQSEGYKIKFTKTQAYISCYKEGLFYALETLRQIFMFHFNPKTETLSSPLYVIEDYPDNPYRGMHLDVSRHFFSVNEIKKYIDMMAKYKYNFFHWHLTDDQGWRIEIKAFPKLTSIGAKRKETVVKKNIDPYVGDGKPYQGFYTQKDIKEVVQYAATRNIQVIPEIDMPGHSMSAIAAYSYLSCSKKEMEVYTNWGSTEHPFCIGNDSTYQFVYKVLDEVISLFPCKYIHIGGDECRRYAWDRCDVCLSVKNKNNIANNEDYQNYFTKKIVSYLNSKNRTAIVWDEILEGNIADSLDLVVMAWRRQSDVSTTAKRSIPVIANAQNPYYINFYQSWAMNEPLAIGGYNSINRIYTSTAIPKGTPTFRYPLILGGQLNLWTEYIKDFNTLSYMAYPRSIAMSEAMWGKGNSKKKNPNFYDRLVQHLKILKQQKIPFSESVFEINSKLTFRNKNYKYHLSHLNDNGTLTYSLNNEPNFLPYTKPIKVKENFIIHTKFEYDGFKKEKKERIIKHKGIQGTLILSTFPERRYFNHRIKNLNDGIMEYDFRQDANRWTGYKDTTVNVNYIITPDLSLSHVGLNILVDTSNHIFPPLYVKVQKKVWYKSGKSKMVDIFTSEKMSVNKNKNKYVQLLDFNFDSKGTSNFYKIIIYPQENQGNESSWLFLDEIIVD